MKATKEHSQQLQLEKSTPNESSAEASIQNTQERATSLRKRNYKVSRPGSKKIRQHLELMRRLSE